MFMLNEGDPGYDTGARYRLDTVDTNPEPPMGDFWFQTKGDADEFITIHGLKHINNTEMEALREALGNNEDGCTM
jgi:hypothetical protein